VPPLPFHNVAVFTESESFLPLIHCESWSNPKIRELCVGERLAAGVAAMQSEPECL
jgi:hypothetical protein